MQEVIANYKELLDTHEYNGWQEQDVNMLRDYVMPRMHTTSPRDDCIFCNGLLHKGLMAILEQCKKDHAHHIYPNGSVPKAKYNDFLIVEWEWFKNRNRHGHLVWAKVYYDDEHFATYGWSPLNTMLYYDSEV